MIFVWLQDLDWYCDYCPPKGTSVVSDLHIRPGVGGYILLCVDVISAFHLRLRALTPWFYLGQAHRHLSEGASTRGTSLAAVIFSCHDDRHTGVE